MQAKLGLVLYGKITKRHGLSGEVKMLAFGANPATLAKAQKIYLKIPERDGPVRFDIARIKIHKNMGILKFHGVDTPEAADTLINLQVLVSKDDLAPLGENEYYWMDLIGLSALSSDGKKIGKISNLIDSTGQDILVIKTAPRGQEFLVPFVEKFVTSVDLEQGTITVEPIEGLFD